MNVKRSYKGTQSYIIHRKHMHNLFCCISALFWKKYKLTWCIEKHSGWGTEPRGSDQHRLEENTKDSWYVKCWWWHVLLLGPKVSYGEGDEMKAMSMNTAAKSQVKDTQQICLLNNGVKFINLSRTQAFWSIDRWHHMVVSHWLSKIRTPDRICW